MAKYCTLLDKLLTENLAADENEALSLVMMGQVLVDEYPAVSLAEKVALDAKIRLRGTASEHPYVTRAGQKLEHGLSRFGVSAAGLTCLDLGAGEGGFTDCLLAHGAAKVYAVDVAYGIFDWKLRNNERVVLLERTNARNLSSEEIPEPIDLLTCDVSFISLKKILPQTVKLLAPEGVFIVLYKPQFELMPDLLGKNGNAKNPDHIAEGIDEMTEYLAARDIHIRERAVSPLRGSNGNEEWLLYGATA
jgi:23S rRNA (cytidine1920-2'-O)/16S rRNA (cytidine1409-2'-O)-methyltransferase